MLHFFLISSTVRYIKRGSILQFGLSSRIFRLVESVFCGLLVWKTNCIYGPIPMNLIEILDEYIPIDTNKYVNYVQSPQCGAIATFLGTTRDTFDGKTVLELRYEAYTPMAIRCIKSICTSARGSWDLHSVAVAHRVGSVPVGEASVFVAVSSVHRADALDACKFVIDEIKASVPIWKKEVYTNGEVWKENSEFLERVGRLGGPGPDAAEKGLRKGGCCGGKMKVKVNAAEE